jgi:hypothetical protein
MYYCEEYSIGWLILVPYRLWWSEGPYVSREEAKTRCDELNATAR